MIVTQVDIIKRNRSGIRQSRRVLACGAIDQLRDNTIRDTFRRNHRRIVRTRDRDLNLLGRCATITIV